MCTMGTRAWREYSNSGDVLSINDFENADKANNDPYYLIKLVDEKNPENIMESFTKMCLLKASKFEDEIIIHLNRNNVFHFDYYTSADQCNSTFVSTSKTADFKTIVQIIKAGGGTRPKLNRALPINPDGTVEKPPEEKSFLQKYWWYLLPIVILLFTGGPAEEPQQQQQQQQHRGGGQAARPARQ
ncbi:hypothetical protein C2G38_2047165 [Gigaspora rosea]|uniref:ER membrane protein complex subunit 10 n=1 Tax=Gigaspora rosea TaxID=44941 RepID=A0A397UFQ7_9GLOM|nr:hypothetical protein C2G38_2047165 [Gigaspora rosea]